MIEAGFISVNEEETGDQMDEDLMRSARTAGSCVKALAEGEFSI